jgi:hypothetical protein
LTPAQRRRFRKLLLRLRTGSEVRGWETEVQRPDETMFPAVLDVTCERSEGRLLGFRWIIEDSTQRKRAQALIESTRDELERQVCERTVELQAANDSLGREVSVRRRAQAEQEKFVRLVESASDFTSDFIGMAELDGQMVYLNPAGLRMAGLERMEDVLATPMSIYGSSGSPVGAPTCWYQAMLESAICSGKDQGHHGKYGRAPFIGPRTRGRAYGRRGFPRSRRRAAGVPRGRYETARRAASPTSRSIC